MRSVGQAAVKATFTIARDCVAMSEPHRLSALAGFDPAPSLPGATALEIAVADTAGDAGAVAVPVATSGDIPSSIGHDRAALAAAAFTGASGQTLTVPRADGPVLVLFGIGDAGALDGATLRDAAGCAARATARHSHLAVTLPALGELDAAVAAQTVIEGAGLARYRYGALQRPTDSTPEPLQRLTLIPGPGADRADLERGAARGKVLAAAAQLSRDLANSPPTHLTATAFAELAKRLGAESGLGVEVFDKRTLIEMGCGGLLGVNAGSAEPPVMIKLSYRPPDAGAHLALVGKGIMYDSGGISLKPADGTHATMKNDMSGAGAVLAAMTTLSALGCRTAVTGYLACTDNMPSGTAMVMGEVITIRGGTTVEVANTDAEGRLVMADAIVLATEESPDAIVDIATLTGACLRALGPEIAGVMGNDGALVRQIEAAAEATDEPVWELPLTKRYRKYLDSKIADLVNLGGTHAGAISAALFLDEFTAGTPWAHIDIAGTAQGEADTAWRTSECTGFGARLLAELALGFTPTGG